MMSGWLDETQLARRRLPSGRGNLREGSELERGEWNRGCRTVAWRSTAADEEEVGSSMPCESGPGYLIPAQLEGLVRASFRQAEKGGKEQDRRGLAELEGEVGGAVSGKEGAGLPGRQRPQ